MTDDPNSRQVGGTHYAHASGMQHWDLVALAHAGYFPGQVTKYTERHSRKNGREDLEKALHFAEKWLSVGKSLNRRPFFLGVGVTVGRPAGPDPVEVAEAVRDYAVDNGLSAIQERIFENCLRADGEIEEVVRLCRVHLYREYGETPLAELEEVVQEPEPDPEPPRAPIPAFFYGEGGPPPPEPYVPGTPEDGGHHEAELQEAVEVALTEDLSEVPDVVVDIYEGVSAVSRRRGKA